MINVGSKWRSNDWKEFVVESVNTSGNSIWVHYAKTDKFGCATAEKYSCLDEAFKERFFQQVV